MAQTTVKICRLSYEDAFKITALKECLTSFTPFFLTVTLYACKLYGILFSCLHLLSLIFAVYANMYMCIVLLFRLHSRFFHVYTG